MQKEDYCKGKTVVCGERDGSVWDGPRGGTPGCLAKLYFLIQVRVSKVLYYFSIVAVNKLSKKLVAENNKIYYLTVL